MVAIRLLFASAVIVLSACKDDSRRDNSEAYEHYKVWYSYESELGIRYRDDTDAWYPPTIEDLDSWYVQVNECVGVWVAPRDTNLLVIRTYDMPEEQINGHYWSPGLIVFLPRDQFGFERMAFKHEILHHVLWHTSHDMGHDSPLFQRCAR